LDVIPRSEGTNVEDQENIKITQSGRIIKKPSRYREEYKNLIIDEERKVPENKNIELVRVFTILENFKLLNIKMLWQAKIVTNGSKLLLMNTTPKDKQ
jgi:hypothetical protein